MEMQMTKDQNDILSNKSIEDDDLTEAEFAIVKQIAQKAAGHELDSNNPDDEGEYLTAKQQWLEIKKIFGEVRDNPHLLLRRNPRRGLGLGWG